MKSKGTQIRIAAVSAGCLLAVFSAAASPAKMEIGEGWKFKQERLTNWYPATVPGVVHTDLIDNGIIEDPFFRLNERGVQWVDKEDWIYETRFDLPEDIYSKDNIRIEFLGLDTYADVWFNGEKIIAANNMFRRWEADLKPYARQRDNELKVCFHSPVKVDMPKWEALPFHYEASNDQAANGGLIDRKLMPFARKAGYHYGWDWGPRLLTAGIWRPVYVEGWNDARIGNVQYLQEEVTARSAKVTAVVEVIADKDLADAELTLTDDTYGKRLAAVKSPLKKGLNKIRVPFTMRNPKLWWSNGLGDPHLYTFTAEVGRGGEVYDSDTQRTGIRSIRVVHEKDEWGRSLCFELNGVPVFAKGANYIPCDNFLPRVTHAVYEKTIRDAVDVNMNMLRVWGGGIYEDDYFYDLCDENGILVWQDFMFACAVYPAEGELLENMRLEAVDNVRRLRNHPCIALWCGNNENQDAWLGWGWKEEVERVDPKYADLVWKQFEEQYYVMLPEVVREHGSGIYYLPSSPFSDYGKMSNDHEGDRHNWDVWHGKAPISWYNESRSRFFSEYGFQSFPGFESVKRYAPLERDWAISSEVMMAHQRGGEYANFLIESYLLSEYYKPKDFPSFLYVSHILQGDAVKTAIEAHRRDRPYCMGTLFWQHNDCWPVASWASRDWYGVWKAQHYFSRSAFADILVSPIEKAETLEVFVVSDRLKDVRGRLTVEVISLKDGRKASSTVRNVTVRANSSNNVFSGPTAGLLNGSARGDVVIHASLDVGDRTYENNYFLGKQKEINFPRVQVARTIKAVENGYEVTVVSDGFARGVFLTIDGTDHHFSDNYFDLLPGVARRVSVATGLSLADFEKQLRIVSLADAY